MPLIVGLLSVLVTFVATWQLDTATRQRDQVRFEAWIEKTQDTAYERIYNHTSLLRGLRGLFSASNHVTAREFRQFVDSFDVAQRYPAVQALGFALKAPASELPQVEAMLHEQAPDARIWPATPRETYYPTMYSRTLTEGYDHLIGFDIAADQAGVEAMQRSQQTLEAAASRGELSFQRDMTAAVGRRAPDHFALYLPVFREDLHANRQPSEDSEVAGFLYAMIDKQEFWHIAFHPVSQRYFDIFVYDGDQLDATSQAFTNGVLVPPREGAHRSRFRDEVTVDIAGRPWTLVFHSKPAFEALSSRPTVVPMTFGGGMLASLVLFLLARSQTRAWMAAHRLNEELQASERQLREVNGTLEQRVAERTAVAEQRAVLARRLANEVTQIEQRERRRLARTLHDHLQQLLVAARFRLQLLNATSNGSGDAITIQQELDNLLHEAIDASRSLTIELSPPIVHESGLGDCLHWLARHVQQQHRLAVDVQVEGEPGTLDAMITPNVKIMLFEAVREALLNTVKYAGVREASIHLRHDPATDMLDLTVADEGVGFDGDKVAVRGPGVERFGLFSIRERLELLNGQLVIDTAPGKGTRITLRLPAHQPADVAQP